jgi:hypothetical protein
MAIAVWRVISLSKTKQRIILGFAILFAVGAVILLLHTTASWFIKIMPEWYSPFYNGFPVVLFTFAYGYFAYSLRKLLKISNTGVKTNAD